MRAFTEGIAVNEMKMAQNARGEIKQLCDFIQRVLRDGARVPVRHASR